MFNLICQTWKNGRGSGNDPSLQKNAKLCTLVIIIQEERTKQPKFGIHYIVDDKLRFHIHPASASKKVNQIFGVIKKTYVTRDATISTLLHLEYRNAIWGPCYTGDLELMEGVQRRATNLVPHLFEKPYEERLKELKLPSMEYRRKLGDMIHCYKITNGLVRLEVSDLFTPSTSVNTRGHHQKDF